MEPNFMEDLDDNIERIDHKEEILGKGLCQPFVDCNSGSRKLMFSIHIEQSLPLINPEVPFVMTGYEQGFSDRSSSIIKADADYEVVGKISKFKDNPQHHYYLILRNMTNNRLNVMERKEYTYSTETYGYAYDTTVLDNLDISYEVPKGEMLRRSTAYDQAMNPANVVNLLSTYVATDVTMEDSMWISESAQKKLSSRLYKRITVNINDNDILLNLMGDPDHYKSFPMIGEEIKGGILCAVRRENGPESLFTQQVEMLRTILMSDDKYTPGDGTVIDLDIHCNNPEMLKQKYSNSQVLYCYNDHIRFITEFVETVDKLMGQYSLTEKDLEFELGKMYYNFKEELNGAQFRSQKVYNGTILEFIVKEVNVPSIGDKLANRYGGKGVIAKILPDDQMPYLALTNEHVEVLINSSTCVNRENIGQFHELSLTHVGKCITDLIKLGYFDTDEAFHEIIKFLSFCSPKEAKELAESLNVLTAEDKESILNATHDFETHMTDSVVHITESERQSWNEKETVEGSQTKANIVQSNLNAHINNADVHVTLVDKQTWSNTYTKQEIDNKFSMLEFNNDWKEAVQTYDDLFIVYPDPYEGWTVNVLDVGITYRFNGEEWVGISANVIPLATAEIDGLMSKTDKAKLDGIEDAMVNNPSAKSVDV